MMPENPIDAYLAAVPEERRPVLEVLRQRIRAIAPDAEEVTSYGIPAFRVEGKVVIGFRANRSDYSIYPFSGGAAQRFPEELQGRTVTSGSIHFTAEDPISDDLLRRIIEWRIQANRERGGSRLEAPMKGGAVEVNQRRDALNPETEWCWPLGPPEVRLPGGSLDALALALAAGDSGAQLLYRTWGYVLEWEDRPPEQENEDVARAMRSYKLTYLLQNRAGMEADDQRTRCGPFVEGVALTREGQGADLAEADHRNLRDAIFRLLDKAGAALDVIG